MSQVLGQNLSDDRELASLGDDQVDVEKFIAENIGEGKKYSTADDALKALAKKALHQDTFIETLKLENQGTKQEMQTLEQKLAEAKKLDDLMAVLTEQPGTPKQEAAPVAKDEIQKLVQEMLQAEKAAEINKVRQTQVEANQNKAFALLADPESGFGSEANAKLAIRRYVGNDEAKADIINRMGAYQPESVAAFLKLQLKDDKTMPGIGDTKHTVTEQVDTSGLLTWQKVKQVKKDNPELYKSRKFQMKIHEAAASNPNFWNN